MGLAQWRGHEGKALSLWIPACLGLGWGVAGSVKSQKEGSRKMPPGWLVMNILQATRDCILFDQYGSQQKSPLLQLCEEMS